MSIESYVISVLGERLENSFEIAKGVCDNKLKPLHIGHEHLGIVIETDFDEYSALVNVVKKCANYYNYWYTSSGKDDDKVPQWLKDYFNKGTVRPFKGMEDIMSTDTYNEYITSGRYNFSCLKHDFQSLDFRILKRTVIT